MNNKFNSLTINFIFILNKSQIQLNLLKHHTLFLTIQLTPFNHSPILQNRRLSYLSLQNLTFFILIHYSKTPPNHLRSLLLKIFRLFPTFFILNFLSITNKRI